MSIIRVAYACIFEHRRELGIPSRSAPLAERQAWAESVRERQGRGEEIDWLERRELEAMAARADLQPAQ